MYALNLKSLLGNTLCRANKTQKKKFKNKCKITRKELEQKNLEQIPFALIILEAHRTSLAF